MAEVITSGGLTVTGVITAVDPALLLPCLGNGDDLADAGLAAAATDQRTVADTFARQLEYAPALAVLDSEEAYDEDRELLGQLHPTALQIPLGEVTWRPPPGANTATRALPGPCPATCRIPLGLCPATRRIPPGLRTATWRALPGLCPASRRVLPGLRTASRRALPGPCPASRRALPGLRMAT